MRKFFTLLLTTSVYFSALGQEAMRVVRCDAVDKNASIQNIYIDEDNQKWVGNDQGLVQVLDLGLGQVSDLPEGQTSVYKVPGGNADITFSFQEFERLAGIELTDENTITCAYFNPTRKELWLGTTESGAFKLSASSKLRLIKSYNAKNSKLKTDQINTIKADPFGRIWIGTNDGVLVGKDDKWDLLERYFNFTSIKLDSTNRTWLLADDLIGYMSRKKSWVPVDLPEAALDGPIIDFTFDMQGYLWVVTEVVARIDLSNEDYDIYGPADYYTSQYATQIEADLDGGIWVATEDKGLYLIEPASAMTVNVLIDQALDCAGSQNNAALAVRVTGGIAPFEYEWEGDLTGENPGNLGQGTYIVTVTDSRGNSKIAKAEITDPSVKARVEMVEKESGLNQNDGKAEVTATQGQSPFSYAWDNGEKTKTAIQLTEGKHQVTVTDDNGCSTVLELEMTRIIGVLAVDIEQSQELKCYGDKNATLTAQVEGGKGPYQYIWSNGATSQSLENMGAGTYAVSITDALDNTTEQTLEVTEPVEFKATIEVLAPASTGQRDGIATLQIENGNKPFRYRWSTRASSDTIQNLAPGDYQLTVTDAKGCISFAEATIQENILELGADLVYEQEIQCFGQPQANFKIVPKGGKGPYQFKWDATTLAGDGSQGLLAGEYQVTVTDATGQSFVKDVIIEEPAEIEVNPKVTSPPSVDQADGVVEMDVKGGVAPYQYKWNTGQTTEKVEGLKAGQYSVEVTDANGCVMNRSFELDENILELQVDISISDSIFCGGTPTGGLVAEVKGGKGPFKYSWNDGFTDPARQALIADFYYVTVEDAVGNSANSQIKLEQPPTLILE
ncbi:MAG: SprB repeat-containing protein, partial [Bacteroidota bacterium]